MHAYRYVFLGAFASFAGALVVGLAGHGVCGSYIVPRSMGPAATGEYAEVANRLGEVAYRMSCNQVDAAGIPFWSLILLGVLLIFTALTMKIFRNERRSSVPAPAEAVRSSTGYAHEALPVATPEAPDVSAKLLKLAEMYREGLLTTDEYAMAKQRLLG